LANEKTPLRDTAPTTPERVQKNADRSTVARRRVIAGIVVALVVIGGLWFLFGRGKDSIIPNPFASPAVVPTFAFKTVVPKYEAIASHLDKKKLEKAAKHATPTIEAVATKFLQAGYVNPDGWGDAGSIDGYFTDDAKQQIDANIDTLTLGKNASDTVDTFTPAKKGNTIKVMSLIDGNLNVIRANAQFTFKGTTANTDGTTSDVTVTGTLFLVPDGNDWKIEAFHINRQEKPRKATSASASASGATS
jgi:hypothetical protein